MRKGSLRLGGIGLIYSYLQDIYFLQPSLPPFQLACLFPCLVIWSYGGLETEKFQAVASQIITITQIRNHIIPTSPNNLTGNEKWLPIFLTFMVHCGFSSAFFLILLDYDLIKKKKPHTHTHHYTITNLIPILYTPITEEVKDLCLEKLEKLRRRTELVIFFSSGQTV